MPSRHRRLLSIDFLKNLPKVSKRHFKSQPKRHFKSLEFNDKEHTIFSKSPLDIEDL